ncbi:MAG TPA: hypothetical protein VFX92_03725 [Candidatus Krumholzibacteria bacterium]|nr:hypothetical protein [Candidatus Krumholzibacteria bacterium]
MMEQKDWEKKLDHYADRTADAVRQGVHILEDAFEKGKETLKEETAGSRSGVHSSSTSETGDDTTTPPRKGSPRLGLVMVFTGIVWLLHSLGILEQPVFPILLIVLGIYFIARSK